MCKPLRTQNFRAPRISWYSFGDICRPFQPSHLKNHEFHFFKKLPTKQSSCVVVHRQLWPCAKPSEPKTFMHQEFHGLHLGKFISLSNPHISKTTNFIFHKTPHQPIKLCHGAPTSLPCANPSELKTFVRQEFHGVHLGIFAGLFNPHISKTTNFIFSQNSPQAIWQCHYAPTNWAK